MALDDAGEAELKAKLEAAEKRLEAAEKRNKKADDAGEIPPVSEASITALQEQIRKLNDRLGSIDDGTDADDGEDAEEAPTKKPGGFLRWLLDN